MVGQVQILPQVIANRIAAGEVVERPSSVVKELVENAVDAGGTRVRVQVQQAGRESITVADDGEGMGRDDALLALERHATSKLRSMEDLEQIGTLGFRGEALPSIASVSRLRLVSRAAGEQDGTVIHSAGGVLGAVEDIGCAQGTEVRVGELFYNVPARRKFLKSDATELRNVVQTMTQLALVHYEVGFELRTESRTLLQVPAGQSLEERVAEVQGSEAPGGLYWHHVDADDWCASFAFAAPHEGRGHSRGLRLFVNNRPVQDRLLVRAVMEGYRGLLEGKRYPLALLWLNLAPEEVDVNVHPAKREVRFRDERGVFRRVAGTVGEALARAPWLAGDPGAAGAAQHAPLGGDPTPERLGRVSEAIGEYARGAGITRGGSSGQGCSMRWSGGAPGRVLPLPAGPGAGVPTEYALDRSGEATGPEGRFSHWRYLGAFDATYLLFEDEAARELVLLDQHAAHERILYEQLLRAAEAREPVSQALLLPLVLDCTAAELAAFEELNGVLAGLGFQVEPFGSGSLAVNALPAGLHEDQAGAVLRDLFGAGDLLPPAAEARDRLEAVVQRAACSAAVKARARLEPSEAAALLADLDGLRNPSHCPHGRPLLLRFRRQEIEGMFHRR